MSNKFGRRPCIRIDASVADVRTTIAAATASDDQAVLVIPPCTKIMPTYTSVCAKCGKVYEFKATVAGASTIALSAVAKD